MSSRLRQILFLCCALAVSSGGAQTPSLEEAVKSRLDLWADSAMSQTNGASYEYFAKLLPPLRYVNADFRFYPIVLSAPNAHGKARLVSNGSGLNLRANARAWHEFPYPAMFRVGPGESPFGEHVQRLNGPHLAEGYLPIVSFSYEHGGGTYHQETFALVDPMYSSNAVVISRFGFTTNTQTEGDRKGHVTLRLDTPESITNETGRLLNAKGEVLVWFDKNWKWDKDRRVLVALFSGKADASALLAVATIPMPASSVSPLTAKGYETQRSRAVETWNSILIPAMNLETPEPVVNNAWRGLVLQNFAIIKGNSLRYSADNQYDALYETEGSDALMAMMVWGYEADTRRLLVPLLDFVRDGIKYQQAGTKLQNVARYYWQTRDSELVKTLQPKWTKEIERILTNRGENGLLPRERYCNDIATPIFSLNSNSKCWRGLRDLGAALTQMGDSAQGNQLTNTAAEFRSRILAAAEKSTDTSTQPPFVPVALFGEEKAVDPICATKMGSYWNLLINFVIGNEALGPGSKYEDWMLQYLQQHGGLCMGMERARPWPGYWVDAQNVNPLYGTRYVLTLLRRDEAERALVSFYGMLAQGFTRETFSAGEGSSLIPLDSFGRQISLPPNTAGNAHFLTMLRHLLVQDLDLNDDGKPETLRLGFATPKRWLETGKRFKVERAPTAFGSVALKMESHLDQGEVMAEVELPSRNAPEKVQLRARVPDGWKVISASIGATKLATDGQGTIDLSSRTGKQLIRFAVEKN